MKARHIQAWFCLLTLPFSIGVESPKSNNSYGKLNRDGNKEALREFSAWWEAMSIPRALKTSCRPPFEEVFTIPAKSPVVESFPCSNHTQLNFTFSGTIDVRHHFQGPGKLTIHSALSSGEPHPHPGTCLRFRQTGIVRPKTVIGAFKDGKPEGLMKITGVDGSLLICHLVQGCPHGLARVWNDQKELIFMYYTYHADVPNRGWIKIKNDLVFQTNPQKPIFAPDVANDLDQALVIHNMTYVVSGEHFVHHSRLEEASFAQVDSWTEANCLLIPEWSQTVSKPFAFQMGLDKFEYQMGKDGDMSYCGDAIKDHALSIPKQIEGYLQKITQHTTAPTQGPRNPPDETRASEPLISSLKHFEHWTFSCQLMGSKANLSAQLLLGKVDVKNQIHGAFTLQFDPETTPKLAPFNQGIRNLSGYFKQGKLLPSVSLHIKDGSKVNTWINKDGVVHGPAIAIGQRALLPLAEEYQVKDIHDPTFGITWKGVRAVYSYHQGSVQGPVWFVMLGGGFLYGHLNPNGQLTGDDIAYVYPDYETAYVGRFEDKVMKAAQEAKVTGLKCSPEGLMKLDFSPPKGPIVFYSPPTNVSFGSGPRIPDPFEAKRVEIRPSRMFGGGEGVFALRDISKDQTACLYSGYLYRNKVEQTIYALQYGVNESLSDDRRRHCSKYSIAVSYTGALIQIPWEVDQPRSWHPTLGPKVNSDFPKRFQNCIYTLFEHPRYGLIDSVTATKDILQGEELFTDYGYTQKQFPTDFLWYHKLKEEYLEELAKGIHPRLPKNV